MARVYYIGDEVTAAGYRLAGADVRVPAPPEVGEVFRRACSDGADVVLLSAALAPEVDPGELAAALIAEAPLYRAGCVRPYPPPDVAHDVRLALGIQS